MGLVMGFLFVLLPLFFFFFFVVPVDNDTNFLFALSHLYKFTSLPMSYFY